MSGIGPHTPCSHPLVSTSLTRPAYAAPAPVPAAGCSRSAASGGATDASRSSAPQHDVRAGGALIGLLAELRSTLAALTRALAGGSGPATASMRGADLVGTARPATATVAPQRSGEDHAFEQRVLELVNAERARVGAAPLRYDVRLDRASELHASHMASVGSMAHEGIGDGSSVERVRSAGFGGAWGENVAVGQQSPEQVVAEWMASPGHRRNILDPAYTSLGVAVEAGTDGRAYWAQSFGSDS